jgi:hypothetical protein
MAPDFIHHTVGSFSTVFVYGAVAVVVVVGLFLFVSESSSGTKPPGCQREPRKARAASAR